jgi:ABC-2 type transport system permease protein
MSFRRYRAIARKELLHIVRDWRSLVLALLLPLVMLLLFGYALILDVDRIPTVVRDLDRTPESRALIREFSGSRYFTIVRVAESDAAVDSSIHHNEALLALVIPADYSSNVLAGRKAQVQAIIDGSDSNTASIALGYVDGLLASYAQRLRAEAINLRGAGEFKPPVDPRIRVWYNTDLKSKNYIVPGLIAVILMIIAALLTSLTIAREWETGTMEQLLSTPVRPVELVLGKLSAFFLIGILDMIISLFVGIVVFAVPMRGNVLFLFLTSCIFLFGALCWGVMVSAITRSQILAFQIGAITSFLPAFLLSGFIFALENMPLPIQLISYVVPARYFVSAVKAIFLQGAGIEFLWIEVLLLVAYGVIVFMIATRKLRQKVA